MMFKKSAILAVRVIEHKYRAISGTDRIAQTALAAVTVHKLKISTPVTDTVKQRCAACVFKTYKICFAESAVGQQSVGHDKKSLIIDDRRLGFEKISLRYFGYPAISLRVNRRGAEHSGHGFGSRHAVGQMKDTVKVGRILLHKQIITRQRSVAPVHRVPEMFHHKLSSPLRLPQRIRHRGQRQLARPGRHSANSSREKHRQ